MRIRIRVLLSIKVMEICDHWTTDPPGPPYFKLLKLLNIDIKADPDPYPAFTVMRIRIQLSFPMRIRIRIQLPN
jgi:hypothetical protein